MNPLAPTEPALVFPTEPVTDAGHNWDYRADEAHAGAVTRQLKDADCWLCRRGVCVQRAFYFLDSCELVVHGTYEA